MKTSFVVFERKEGETLVIWVAKALLLFFLKGQADFSK